MGKDVIIRGETYNGVGKVNLLTANGSANFYDVSGALCTITAEYDEVEEYDEVYTSDKTAQEVYDALEVGINPVFRFHNLLDDDAYIYASMTKLESTADGEELTLSSFQTDAMTAATASDYFTLTVQGEAPAVEKTVSGSLITITDALAEPAVALSTDINLVQNLHGQSFPWSAGGNTNKWDEEWEVGRFDITTGADVVTNDQIRAKNKVPCKGGTQYYFESPVSCWFIFYDSTQTVITSPTVPGSGGSGGNSVVIGRGSFTTPTNAAFYRFYATPSYGATYNNNIAVNYPSSVTAYTPYSNICPISGFSAANIVVSPTTTAGDGTTYTVSFGTAGTVYGGTLDVVNGTLTVTHAKLVLDGTQTELDGVNWRPQANSVAFYYNFTNLDIPDPPTINVATEAISDTLKAVSYNTIYGNDISSFAVYHVSGYNIQRVLVRITDTSLTTAAAINAYLSVNPITIVYPLVTPQTVTLTPTEVQLLLGTNNVWSDTGDTTLTYLADGRVNSLTALNMLLGGMYEPSSDVTDKEALSIIMGETE